MYSISGGSRIFLGEGPNSQGGCANLFFSRKLHENETILTPNRRVPRAPPLDTPMSIDLQIESDLHFASL